MSSATNVTIANKRELKFAITSFIKEKKHFLTSDFITKKVPIIYVNKKKETFSNLEMSIICN